MEITRIEPGEIMSRVVVHGETVNLAGMAADKKTNSIEDQTRQTLAKIDRFLEAAGTDKSRLLTATVYLSDMKNKAAMNEVWKGWIDTANPPTRACVSVGLAPSTLVEIVVSAAKP